jgi:hypothetical protein
LQVVRQLDAVGRVVVRRLLAVARYVFEHKQPEVKVARATRVPLRRRVVEAGKASGHVLRFSAGVVCTQCRQSSRMKQALTSWAVAQCPGPGKKHGHTVQCYRGLCFCTACGQWAGLSGASSRGIHKACTGQATKRGKELLARMACDPPRLPDLHGRRAWPDGTPADPPAALAAAVGRQRRGAGVPSIAAHPATTVMSNSRMQAVLARVRAREQGRLQGNQGKVTT